MPAIFLGFELPDGLNVAGLPIQYERQVYPISEF